MSKYRYITLGCDRQGVAAPAKPQPVLVELVEPHIGCAALDSPQLVIDDYLLVAVKPRELKCPRGVVRLVDNTDRAPRKFDLRVNVFVNDIRTVLYLYLMRSRSRLCDRRNSAGKIRIKCPRQPEAVAQPVDPYRLRFCEIAIVCKPRVIVVLQNERLKSFSSNQPRQYLAAHLAGDPFLTYDGKLAFGS